MYVRHKFRVAFVFRGHGTGVVLGALLTGVILNGLTLRNFVFDVCMCIF